MGSWVFKGKGGEESNGKLPHNAVGQKQSGPYSWFSDAWRKFGRGEKCKVGQPVEGTCIDYREAIADPCGKLEDSGLNSASMAVLLVTTPGHDL
ncbi:hypothetical protein PoB_002918300 [Plakobranchus ocellatus]|uniref:Uncharacterized protein n=1 Tax=Plakobranchus ocellatus TaxID=259542 RepID=A0AAV4A647_9GAST|nr:hypothetical protein PoB_002918300 [Plakobranchus ocellatus]